MAIKVVMPKLGLTMTTGTIAQWLKKEGDPVTKGEDLLEISTEKITNTVECPADGVLLKILAPEGSKLPVSALLGYVGSAGEHIDVPDNSTNELETQSESSIIQEKNDGESKIQPSNGKVKITPVAVKLAKELNIDYTVIVGTGPGGRITKEDVEKFAAQPRSAEPEKIAQQPAASSGMSPIYEAVPYSGMRKAIGDNMTRSWTVVPKITHHVSVDVSKLVQLRQMMNEDLHEGDVKVSLNDILIKIVARALAIKPNINVSLDGNQIKVLKDINIGVAVALEAGLLVPVIKNANTKNLYQISREVKELALKARSGSLGMDDMSGGTFTISNMGAFGSVDYFTPIINQPESAILGVGRVVETPVVVDGQIVIRPIMGLSLSFDHRIIDGAPAGEFLQMLMGLISSPLKAILSND